MKIYTPENGKLVDAPFYSDFESGILRLRRRLDNVK